jgi:hypothetical protein
MFYPLPQVLMKRIFANGWALLLVLAISAFAPLAEAKRINTKVNNKQSAVRLFEPFTASRQLTKRLDSVSKAYLLTMPNATAFAELIKDRPLNVNISIPTKDGDLVAELGVSNFMSPDVKFTVRDENGVKPLAYQKGLHYQGQFAGDPTSHIAISFFANGQIIGVAFSAKPGGNLVIGRLETKGVPFTERPVVIYDDQDLKVHNNFMCGTTDEFEPEKSNKGGLMPNYKNEVEKGVAANCKTITNYWEAGFTMYVAQGSSSVTTTNHLTAIFNVVNQLYNIEQLHHTLSRVQINTASDATRTTTSNTVLDDFSARQAGGFAENLAHYFTAQEGLGGLAYVDILCRSQANLRTGMSDLDLDIASLPAYSWDSEVTTHEMGHNCGSRHTQWCGWNKGGGVIGNIDSCYATEAAAGSTACYTGTPVARIGTIMSYCHLNGSIDLANGFGPLPGATIRAEFAGASCLSGVAAPTLASTGSTSTCLGETVNLSVNTVAGATYLWSGPNGYTANTASISRTNLASTGIGTYTVQVTVNNCTYTARPVLIAQSCVTLTNPSKVASLCVGDNLPFAATLNGVAQAGTSMAVQLSNASGSFASPTVLGTFTNTSSINTSLTGTSSIGAGSYRLRVVTSHRGTSYTNVLPLAVSVVARTAAPTTPSAQSLCGSGPVTFTAPVNTFAKQWFSPLGSQVSTASSYTTPTLNASANYTYVQTETATASVGKTTATGGSNRSVASSFGNWLRVFRTMRITGFTVNADAAGTGTINLLDSATKSLAATANYSYNSGNTNVTGLSITLQPGVYLMSGSATANLYRTNSGGGYPYSVAGVCEMLGADNGGPPNFSTSFVYWYYNIQLSYTRCPSSPVTYAATVTNLSTPTVSPAGPLQISGPTVLTAPAGFSYLWSNSATTQSITVSTAGSYSVRTIQAGCTSTSSAAVVVTLAAAPTYVWNGTGAFSTAANWSSNTVPSGLTAADTIYINSGTCTLDQNRSYPNVVVRAGGTLALGAFGLTTSATFRNLGTVSSAAAGVLTIGQGTARSLGTTTLPNIILGSTGNVTVIGGFRATTSMRCNNTITLSGAADKLTLGASATGSASYHASSNASFVGNATQFVHEVWLDPSKAGAAGGWYFLGNSINTMAVSQFGVGNTFASNTFNNAVPTGSSLYLYDPTNGVWPSNQGWVKTTANATLSRGQGARVWVSRARILAGVLTFTGFPDNTTVNRSMLYCAAGCTYGTTNGYNLVGNPFASSLDWDLVTKNQMVNSVAVWRQDRLQYTSYVNGVGVNGGSNLIARGQAFFVQALNGSGSLSITTAAISTVGTTFYRQASVDNLVKVSVLEGGQMQDEIAVRLTNTATDGFDNQLEAPKIMGNNTNIYSTGLGSTQYAIQARTLPIANDLVRIPVLLDAVRQGQMLHFAGLASLTNGLSVYLTHPTFAQPIQLTEGMDLPLTAAMGTGLELVFGQSSPTTIGANLERQTAFSLQPNPATSVVQVRSAGQVMQQVEVIDAVGKVVLTLRPDQTEANIDLDQLSPATYLVRVTGTAGVSNKKLVVVR